jgi:hypothetical protein
MLDRDIRCCVMHWVVNEFIVHLIRAVLQVKII